MIKMIKDSLSEKGENCILVDFFNGDKNLFDNTEFAKRSPIIGETIQMGDKKYTITKFDIKEGLTILENKLSKNILAVWKEDLKSFYTINKRGFYQLKKNCRFSPKIVRAFHKVRLRDINPNYDEEAAMLNWTSSDMFIPPLETMPDRAIPGNWFDGQTCLTNEELVKMSGGKGYMCTIVDDNGTLRLDYPVVWNSKKQDFVKDKEAAKTFSVETPIFEQFWQVGSTGYSQLEAEEQTENENNI